MTATEKAISAILEEKKCAFCAYRAECRKTCGIMFGYCESDFCADADRVKKAVLLAKRLSAFAREWNTWDYRDAVDAAGGLAAVIQNDAESLLRGDRDIESWLEECIEEQEDADGLDDYDYLEKRAARLLRDVRRFIGDHDAPAAHSALSANSEPEPVHAEPESLDTVQVLDRETGKLVCTYDRVLRVRDTFTDNGVLAYQIEMLDGNTATFNKIDYKAEKLAWIAI